MSTGVCRSYAPAYQQSYPQSAAEFRKATAKLGRADFIVVRQLGAMDKG
ncbi:hypothetical protein JFK97_10265 [Chromobacterium phragmitis]|nr:hypothetical protein [Chromobacterium amazonense]MBM2884768.1 hypothetical protein [Chromobacterium amazonense]MDE1714877.1 hypothetical protein [Chromobacterium amazonense]